MSARARVGGVQTGVIEEEPGELALASEFPAATRQQWQRLVARVLGSSSDAPELELATVTADGIEILPLYVADAGRPDPGYPGQAPFVRGRTAAGTGPGGTSGSGTRTRTRRWPGSRSWRTSKAGSARCGWGSARARSRSSALPDVLAEVYLDLAAVVLDAGARFAEAAEVFLGVAARRGVPACPAGCLGARSARGAGADRLGGGGRLERPPGWPRCSAELPGVRAIVVDGLPFHEAGGTDAQELGCALAAGCGVPAGHAAAGLSGAAAHSGSWSSGTPRPRTSSRRSPSCAPPAGPGPGSPAVRGPGQRRRAAAARRQLVADADPPRPVEQHPARHAGLFRGWCRRRRRHHRRPFDAAIGQPDRLARRVARNTHAVLAEESHVARVIDPAGGSWYVEDLTEQLAARAWVWFQDIERSGGLRAALAAGSSPASSRPAGRPGGTRWPGAGRPSPGSASSPGRRDAAGPAADRLPDRAGRAAADPVGAVARGTPRPRGRLRAGDRVAADGHAGVARCLPGGRGARAAVTALLAPAGIATVTADGLVPGAVIVCGDPMRGPMTCAAVGARAGASRGYWRHHPIPAVAAADEVITDGMACSRWRRTGCSTRWGCRDDPAARLAGPGFRRGRARRRCRPDPHGENAGGRR
jgi:hypothetical protein